MSSGWVDLQSEKEPRPSSSVMSDMASGQPAIPKVSLLPAYISSILATYIEALTPKSVQGYVHDLHFVADDYDTVSWGAGTIKFYDGTTQAVDAGNTGNLADTTTRYIYFDLDDANPNVLKVGTIAAYITALTTQMGVLCLIQKGSAAGINATVVPSYGKEPLITADVIQMAGLLEVDLGGGAKLQAILSTQISSGYLKLTASTVKDGSWYDESGVEINAASGINIYGTANALTTRATKTGTIQCYVGADGILYAGAGAVRLDVNGLSFYGAGYARWFSGATFVGYMEASSTSQLKVTTYAADMDLYLNAHRDATLIAGQDDVISASRDVNITAGVDITMYSSEGVSIKAGSAPTAASLDDLRLEADDELHIHGDRVNIGSGTTTPPGAANDITISAEDDVVIGAGTSITLQPTGTTTILRLNTEWTEPARSIDTTYTNSSGYPLLIVVSMNMPAGAGGNIADIKMHASSDPPTTVVSQSMNDTADQLYLTMVAVVPNGYKYRVNDISGSPAIIDWHEYAIGKA